jgi:hypothetical protein
VGKLQLNKPVHQPTANSDKIFHINHLRSEIKSDILRKSGNSISLNNNNNVKRNSSANKNNSKFDAKTNSNTNAKATNTYTNVITKNTNMEIKNDINTNTDKNTNIMSPNDGKINANNPSPATTSTTTENKKQLKGARQAKNARKIVDVEAICLIWRNIAPFASYFKYQLEDQDAGLKLECGQI